MDKTEFARLRKAAGLGRMEAAHALGVHLNTVGRYERGEITIPSLTAQGIRTVLEPLAARKDGVKTAPRPSRKARKT